MTRRQEGARCQALTSTHAYLKDNVDRPCSRKASIEGFCTQHHKQHEKVVASRIGEDDVCSFCVHPAGVFRTSRGEGLVMMCDACADAIRRLLTFGEDKRALVRMVPAVPPAPLPWGSRQIPPPRIYEAMGEMTPEKKRLEDVVNRAVADVLSEDGISLEPNMKEEL